MKTDTEGMVKLLRYYGGTFGILLPFFIFLVGVVFIALSGAPDERGFWPILILALGIGLVLSKDKHLFSTTVIEGMSQQIVMIMIMAWMLASIIGILMTITGLVEALIWLSNLMQLNGTGFTIITFIICCIISLSTGSSFATILICSPILYPAGGIAGAHLATLAGAIIAGATFGDFSAPISDTTIASALSQKADIGQTVRSRVKYILPAFIVAILAFSIHPSSDTLLNSNIGHEFSGTPDGLPMLLVPIFIIYLFLKGKHLVHGLLMGLLFGVCLGLVLGLLPLDQLLSLDLENFTAKSFIIDGINRAVGISFFTILLMGLVATLKAGGLIDRLVHFAEGHIHSKKQAEGWITGITSLAILLFTHSIVAILTVAEFAQKTGSKMGVEKIRRANLLSLVVCVFPFLLPYFIPVILMANMTSSGAEFGIPKISPFEVGMHNYLSWALLGITMITLVFGSLKGDDDWTE